MKSVAIIGNLIPEPKSTAAGKRMLQIIHLLLSAGYKVKFLSTSTPSDFSFELSSIDVEVYQIFINDSSFDRLIGNLNPDFIIFDRFNTEEQFGWRVAEICPNAVRILDTEDLHFLRKARESAFKNNRNLEFSDLVSDTFKREIASIVRCDISLIISEFEMNLLINTFKIDSDILFYLPLFAESKPSSVKFEDRHHFISIGNFLHEPNWQTVLKLKCIWNSIKQKLPHAEMHIYGAYVTPKAQQLHSEKDKFLIKGRADDVENIFNNAKVLLAPIPFGAGVKGKLLESMMYGLPNVTTEIGCEGMHGSLPWNGFIENDDNKFIENAIVLYTDKQIWEQSQINGYKIIKKRNDKQPFSNDFLNQLNQISTNLHQHRMRNFWGQILMHHNLQSTKYMSKWIEEKNKNI